MVPEIWRYGLQQTDFFVTLGLFPPFTPLTSQKIKILKIEKKTKTSGDIIILHKCTINDNHMMHGF